ncbi:hypothetical protein EDD18DRAFT_1414805 [Armillaria luteobubalina]|uniref:DUF6532 domain-containing protein n=1 Tax=Armillaria luteobubalina TaxID=153913 RepID=A0AA39UJP1_9AGAR|nr:hypothetical protein EDD18DRAFT_1414805 [Armillaria luteobubalina]
MKTTIRPFVIALYGFILSGNTVMIQQNKKRYLMLAASGAFMCKDPMTMHHQSENKIFPMVVIEYFFHHHKAPGIIWEDNFNPIKPETIALAVTLIKHCLNEWADGTFKAQKLHNATQAGCYINHLKDTTAWCAQDARVMTNIHQGWKDTNGYIDDAEREHLHADLQGCSGETDSEAEDEPLEDAGNAQSED